MEPSNPPPPPPTPQWPLHSSGRQHSSAPHHRSPAHVPMALRPPSVSGYSPSPATTNTSQSTARPPSAAATRKSGGGADAESIADEPSTASTTSNSLAPAQSEVARQVVTQLSDAMHESLLRVAEQFGVDDVRVRSRASAASASVAASTDARVLVAEVQKLRRRERELLALVEDLQTEQRMAKERLALHSILTLKLKRELVNEKLAHIDSKKEMDELRTESNAGGNGSNASGGSGSASAHTQPRSPETGDPTARTDRADDDPWTSPNKSGADAAAAAAPGLQLPFGSFYSSRQPTSQDDDADGDDDEDDEDAGEDGGRASGLQPLRNSLMGQFLPSALLDSPQLTPTARSSAQRSTDNQMDDDDEEEDEGHDDNRANATSIELAQKKETEQLTRIRTELERELTSFALSPRAQSECQGCGRVRAPVVEVVDCGHRLCRPCERGLLQDVNTDGAPLADRRCPRCDKAVITLRRLGGPDVRRGEDNQVDHLHQDSRPSSSDSTATAVSTATASFATGGAPRAAAVPVAPLTLSLFGELFENIPTDELETILREAGSQVSAAIEHILQRHPSFNPALAAEVSVTTVPGGASRAQAQLHRATSAAGTSQQVQPGGATSNWKTEMCMYYLQGKCNKTRRTCSFAHGESDLVRSTAVKHTSSTSYKSRMCPMWLEGSCPKSRRECPLAHGENDLRDGMAMLSQNVTGPAGGGGGSGSILAPSMPTTAPRLQNYKTELCYYYLKGCCNYNKEECRFAHGESDLRTVESNTLEWSAQLAGTGAGSVSSGYMSEVSAATMANEKMASSMQQQHQYQQQFMQQFQPQQQQPQQIAQHAFGVPHHVGPAPFVPQSHQYHQLPPPAMHHHQLQPPGMPGPQQGLYGAAQAQHQPQYRYMKSMDETKSQRLNRPPPPRREASWSQQSYDSLGSDF